METEINQVASDAKVTECGSCGGRMEFDPGSQGMKCPYCGGNQSIEMTKDQVIEIDLADMNKYDFNWNAEKKTITCENCGGQTLTEINDETQYCAYCGSQHIIKRQDTDLGMRPQGILPYQITFDEAKARLKGWIKKRFFAPNDLKSRYLDRHLQGVYVPYWTFDAQTNTGYSCQVGTYYYTGTGDNRKRHTRWRNHSGQYSSFFDDVLVPGVTHEQLRYIKKVEPYNMSLIVDYKPDFLAGYFAQKYTVMPDHAFLTAKDTMESEISATIKRSLPGDTYRLYTQQVHFSAMTFKHLLLPVYLMSYKYQSKMYHVAINGQTGKVQGQSPLSPFKVGAAIILGIVVAVIILKLTQG